MTQVAPRWPYPRILAHRGGGTLAPENTLAALRTGLRYGHHAIECDAMLASDGVPVVMHDCKLGRTVRGHGSVANVPARDLTRLDAGSWFGPDFIGEPVPLLTDFIRFCQQHAIWMNIEIKPVPGHEATTGAVVAATTAALFADEVATGKRDRLPLLSSFSLAALAAARGAAPGLPRAFLCERLKGDWLACARSVDASAIHVHHAALSPQLARAIRMQGFGLLCYTVDAPARARTLFDWGVDALCTDRIDLIPAQFA